MPKSISQLSPKACKGCKLRGLTKCRMLCSRDTAEKSSQDFAGAHYPCSMCGFESYSRADFWAHLSDHYKGMDPKKRTGTSNNIDSRTKLEINVVETEPSRPPRKSTIMSLVKKKEGDFNRERAPTRAVHARNKIETNRTKSHHERCHNKAVPPIEEPAIAKKASKKFWCNKCHQGPFSREWFHNHQRNNCRTERFYCPACGRVSISLKQCHQHIKDWHPKLDGQELYKKIRPTICESPTKAPTRMKTAPQNY